VPNRNPNPAIRSERKWKRSAELIITVNAVAAAKGTASRILLNHVKPICFDSIEKPRQ
jgi:hypothetical protein